MAEKKVTQMEIQHSKPNFFIIGAPKCGTTSLAAWLAEHPYVYMSPIKEPFFFSRDLRNSRIQDWNTYLRLFEGVQAQHQAIGEASTIYLFSKVAVPAIEEEIPGAKYIVMLRNPVEMVYSLHEQQYRSFNEDVEVFWEAWKLAGERKVGRHIPPKCKDPVLLNYPEWGRLGEQLERLYRIVPRERVLVILLDDVKENPRREYLRVLDFLSVPDDGRNTFPVYNPARAWRSRYIARFVRALAKTVSYSKYVRGILPRRSLGIVRRLESWNTRKHSRPPLSPAVRTELEAYFAKEVERLERLLGRNLSHWRSLSEVE
ncbi:MAG: sulfotransferase [Bacteroidetes bacterium]|nr:MAG: sulfotransferase [Bacteroidota bacterium]